MQKEPFLLQFIEICRSVLGNNLVGILYIGSRQRGTNTIYSDFDFALIIEDYNEFELAFLRRKFRNLDREIDVPIVFLSLLPKKISNFRVGNHGLYYLEVLKKSEVVYGSNPLTCYKKLNKGKIQASLCDKISEYWLEIQRVYIEGNKTLSQGTIYKLNRRLAKALYDITWLVNNKPLVNELNLNEYDLSLFNKKEEIFIKQLFNLRKTKIMFSKTSEQSMKIRMSIMFKIYIQSLNYLI